MDRRGFIKKTAVAAATTAMATPAMAMLTKVDSAGLVEGEGELVQEASRPDGRTPKVLLVNGSPRRDGNTFCCLQEIEKQLQKHGMLTEIVQIGAKPIRMCVNCGACKRNDGAGCAFRDDLCAVITEKMKECDALIVGTPVYYGQPNGGILSLMQRLFYSAGHLVQNKPAAAVAVCRRGGATATLQTMNMMFEMMNMPIGTLPTVQERAR